jgi:NADH dehydrogenase FAD-containing subunit
LTLSDVFAQTASVVTDVSLMNVIYARKGQTNVIRITQIVWITGLESHTLANALLVFKQRMMLEPALRLMNACHRHAKMELHAPTG